MNHAQLKALINVINYLWDNEKDSYEELDRPVNHIFTDIEILKDYTEKTKTTDRLIDRYELVTRYLNNQTDEEWGRLLTAINHRHKETDIEIKDTPTMA